MQISLQNKREEKQAVGSRECEIEVLTKKEENCKQNKNNNKNKQTNKLQ